MNYAALSASIQAFAVDAEPTFLAQIPNFVRATEKRIINDADLPLAVAAAADIPLTVNIQTITPPSDFMSVESLAVVDGVGEYAYLLRKTVDFLTSAFPIPTETSTPRFYAVAGTTTLLLAPVSDGNYTCKLRYLRYPASIVDTGTSWIGDNYEHALLYGSLRDAAVFLKEEADVVTMYNNQYNEALGQLKTFGTERSRVDKYRRR